jgi:hypothetical protein
MIEIRYSAPNEVDISGTVDELQFVRREILNLTQSDASQIIIDADSDIDPAPYKSVLSKLIILKTDCSTKVSLKDEKEIQVEGSPDCLAGLASFFDFNLDDGKGAHSHYEYYEGNQWIAPDSMPLVISVK